MTVLNGSNPQESANIRPISCRRKFEFEVLDLEIDRMCDACTPEDTICSYDGQHTSPAIPLYKYSELPEFLRGNPYVITGYRSLLPFSICLKSLFVWTNESVNIWSHLCGFLLFFVLLLWDCVMFLPSTQASAVDYIIMTIGLICYQFCMLASTGYHLFLCHSERASRRWLALDLTGISVGILGCYLPAVHYAFYCLSVWRDVYLVLISLLFGAVLYCQTNPVFLSPRWATRRLVLYIFLCGYGVIPAVHWVLLNDGFSSPIVQIFLPKLAVMYVLGAVAFGFFISKYPERCCPGHFDYVGSSHQMWHLLVILCFYWWHKSGQELLIYRLMTEC